MEKRAEALRRWIAFYRQHLREGVDDVLTQHYLLGIATDEAELADIEPGADKRE